MQLSAAEQGWDVSVEPGPAEMLRSGRWDATSQLLDNGPQVDDLIKGLPYLNGFRLA